MTKKLLLAGVAAGALVLSACGGDTDPTNTTAAPVETTTAAAPVETTADPVEITTEAAPVETTTDAAPAETDDAPVASGDLPFETGSVDTLAFAELVTDALADVQNVRTVSSPAGGEATETITDLTDPTNPRSYSVRELGDETMEMISDNTGIWQRTGEGAWEFAPHAQEVLDQIAAQGDTRSPEYMARSYQSIELVDAATKQFEALMDLSVALGGPPAEEGQGLPVTVWLDEANRVAKQEIRMGEMVVVNDLEYDVDFEIPEVG